MDATSGQVCLNPGSQTLFQEIVMGRDGWTSVAWRCDCQLPAFLRTMVLEVARVPAATGHIQFSVWSGTADGAVNLLGESLAIDVSMLPTTPTELSAGGFNGFVPANLYPWVAVAVLDGTPLSMVKLRRGNIGGGRTGKTLRYGPVYGLVTDNDTDSLRGSVWGALP